MMDKFKVFAWGLVVIVTFPIWGAVSIAWALFTVVYAVGEACWPFVVPADTEPPAKGSTE